MRIVRVSTPGELAQCHAVRAEVFIGEQGVSRAEEIDGHDEEPTTYHVLALSDTGEPVGTARLLVDGPGRVHVGRVAVRAGARGSAIGRALMEAVERIALAEVSVDRETKHVIVELSAQESAIGFYERLGYEIDARRYLDARMWHRDARKVLRSDPAGASGN